MCGRYAVFTEEENQEIREIINEVNERYKDDSPKMKTGEIFPTNIVPVICANPENKKIVNLFKWGFPDFKRPGSVIINARSETVHEKPTFRKLLHNNRCIIPASEFYEWKSIGGKKEKYSIKTNSHNFFYMAGLYNSFIDKSGKTFTSFVIITTEANNQMAEIHNRMPIVMDMEYANNWITIPGDNQVELNKILIPYANSLTIEKVS